MKKHQIDQIVEDGGLLVRSIIQIVGKPKEHVEKTLHEFVTHLKDLPDSGFTIIKESFAEAQEQEESESLFSAFCETEVVCNDANGLLNFCMEAMPSSVEVIEPESYDLKAHELSNMLNDFVEKMHRVDMIAKQANQQSKLISKNLAVMIQNAIVILLNMGPRTVEDIAKIIGVPEKEMPEFLNRLVEDGRIVEKDGKYDIKKE